LDKKARRIFPAGFAAFLTRYLELADTRNLNELLSRKHLGILHRR
jgi:hypothetical protein